MATILLVDDDPNILQLVRIHLSEQGYRVFEAKDGMAALDILKKEPCDLAIVDVMMPYMDGYTLTKEIRVQYDIPIILLTAKSQIEDKEQGFQAGTDDYLVKPFEPKELSFRIKALLRRYDSQGDEGIFHFGETTINKKATKSKLAVGLSFLPLKEFELLYYLASNPRQVFSREHLIEQIWGLDFQGDERTVDVHIKRLRERFSKVTDDFQIKTVRGVGYMVEAQQS